jgi:hypothetical protein
VCAPRTSSSSGYCQPHVSSSYYQEYWSLCEANENVIEGKYEGFYWYLKTQYATYYEGTDLPDCKETIWEFAQLTIATDELNTASGLLLVAGLFLA